MSLEPKEQWDPLAPKDPKAQEVNKAFWGWLEHGVHQDLLESQESQVLQGPKDHRDCLAPPAAPGPKVTQELPAGL